MTYILECTYRSVGRSSSRPMGANISCSLRTESLESRGISPDIIMKQVPIPRRFHITRTRLWQGILLAGLLCVTLPGSLRGQMTMDPYFAAINYPLEEHSLMLMVMPDVQSARYGNNFLAWMLMAEYGITPRWTVAIMAEGQKIGGQPATFGGMRYATYYHLFRDDRLLNVTLYGEFEDLNGAALYKMEIAGLGSGDLTEPLALVRDRRVRTIEQRVILYHDWNRLNATFNFIRETALQAPYGSDYGYALGLFLLPSWMTGSMEGMADMTPTPALSTSRLGYGLEMIGTLGDNQRFGFDWNAQQHYLGAVLMYDISSRLSVRLEPAVGLSDVSDHFMLRTGVSCMFGPSASNAMEMSKQHF